MSNDPKQTDAELQAEADAAADMASLNESEDAAEGEEDVNEAGFAVIEALQAENVDLRDKLLRAIADAENIRKRGEREKTDAARYASANFARDMLQVGDNLRRALETLSEEDRATMSDTVKSLVEGVEMTERSMLATFERHGIKQVMPQTGDRFDANLHEAMFEVPGTGQPGGSIVQVLEAGYTIGDRLLRAARVGVAKADGTTANGSQVDTSA
ncbi:MAG: nucleotide exchange factor GrpE [Rhizobiales bacterium]|nr:nucleotide exchange factor GrpE [Hyphomicrobiales bacterium]